jgi:hypothetical protein
MSFAAFIADLWTFVGFHAAVFAAVVFALLAIQWLLGGRDR